MDWLKFKYKLLVALFPWTWMRSHKIDTEWDAELWQKLVDDELVVIGEYNAVIGDSIVWIENASYADGALVNRIVDGNESLGRMPEQNCSRATAMLLRVKIKEYALFNILKAYSESEVYEKYGIQ